MEKTIGVTEFQQQVHAVFTEVADQHTSYVLTRNSRPAAVLIAYADFQRYQSLQEQAVLARFDRLVARMADQNSRYTENEVAADIATIRAELGN